MENDGKINWNGKFKLYENEKGEKSLISLVFILFLVILVVFLVFVWFVNGPVKIKDIMLAPQIIRWDNTDIWDSE